MKTQFCNENKFFQSLPDFINKRESQNHQFYDTKLLSTKIQKQIGSFHAYHMIWLNYQIFSALHVEQQKKIIAFKTQNQKYD